MVTLYISTTEMQRKLTPMAGILLLGVIVGVVLIIKGRAMKSLYDYYRTQNITPGTSGVGMIIFGVCVIVLVVVLYFVVFLSEVAKQR